MTASEASFYFTEGTLKPDAPSYVERQADQDLYDGLCRGEFCYVLMSRQMGKSSLVGRCAARLRQEDFTVVLPDLTGVGQNLTPEQWYVGLLNQIGEPLGLEDQLEAFWFDHEHLGPLQRWMTALREVVLSRVNDRLVFFIDEIDQVRSLPFSTDEFFAGIRECYTRRTEDPQMERVTFCLIGVAAPSDLIRDTRTTPFNIGQRIELTDFTAEEAGGLARGLGQDPPTARAILDRVLHWTGGHPYLTQRLCREVSLHPADFTDHPAEAVDRLCDGLFLSARAREQDTNLLFVRESLVKTEADLASLLDLYGKVRQGRKVVDDPTNPLVTLLGLSGITRTAGGGLRVRNRIYAHVFDRGWVEQSMPDTELQRQRSAFRRGIFRAVSVSTAILVLMGALAVAALDSARHAREERRITRRYIYVSDMNIAQQAWERGNIERTSDLLEAHRPRVGDEDIRGFEWRYLRELCDRGQPRATLQGHSDGVWSVALSPDGKLLASGSNDRTVKLWDPATGREITSRTGLSPWVSALTFSPDGQTLAYGNGDSGLVRLKWGYPFHTGLHIIPAEEFGQP